MDAKEAMDSFISDFREDHRITTESNNSSKSRLVWFVALAGYGFINISPFLDSMFGETFSNVEKILISLPWVITILVGVIAHMRLGDFTMLDDSYYLIYLSALTSFRALRTNEDRSDDLVVFFNIHEADSDVIEARDNVNKMHLWANRFERGTYYLIIFSFFWSVIGPLVFSLLC